MNGFDWGWLIVAVLILCTNAIAYILGDEHGREQERPRAWGDGYREGHAVGYGEGRRAADAAVNEIARKWAAQSLRSMRRADDDLDGRFDAYVEERMTDCDDDGIEVGEYVLNFEEGDDDSDLTRFRHGERREGDDEERLIEEHYRGLLK